MGEQRGKDMGEQGFEGLEFYQDSLKLLKAAYRLADELPKYEQFNLADQLRRAACSISLNIAEAYGQYHYLEKLRFLYIARGSLAETCSAFTIAQTVGYCDDHQLRWVRSMYERIEKNLNGYCRFIRSQQQGGSEYGTRYLAEEPTMYTHISPTLVLPPEDYKYSSPEDYKHSSTIVSQSPVPNPQSPIPSPPEAQ